MAERNTWIGFVEETREALANLQTDELEALAERAQTALAATAVLCGTDLRELAARHRVLGDVLQATASNLNVLRRLGGQEPDGSSRWVR
jgi:hypothetical protein